MDLKEAKEITNTFTNNVGIEVKTFELKEAISTILQELDNLQKENESIKARVDKYIQGGNETLKLQCEETLKYYHENYISKDKIREKIEELKQDFLEYTEEFQGKCDDTDEYYFYDTQNMQNKINLLENLLKEE